MKRWLWRGLVIGVLLAIGVLAATFYFLGTIVKKGVESAGPAITKTSVGLDSATLSVFSGDGTLKNFVVGNPEGFTSPFAVRARAIKVGVQPGSLFGDKVIVRTIRIEAPEITFEAKPAGNNLSRILKNIRGTEQPRTSNTPKLQVNDLLVTGGKIHLTTPLLGGQSATLILPEIHLTNLGQSREGITAAELSERIFQVMVEETLKQVAQSSIGKSLPEAARKMSETGGQSLEKATRGLQDILKKK